MEPARRHATYEDVKAAPDTMVAELIDGQLFLHPRPAKPHTVTASNLGAQLNMAFDLGRTGPGGWWILDEPELHVLGQILVPDLAGWLRAEVPELELEQPFFQEVPSWVAEVLSPGNESHDRVKKLRIYASAGVRHAWLIHPEQRSLEVFAQKDGAWSLIEAHEDDAVLRSPPFEALELELSTLWLSSRSKSDAR
jgi:Uma2 family endonuclease